VELVDLVRVARKEMGKSGGARVVYIRRNERFSVFLTTVFPKNQKENLSMAERNALIIAASPQIIHAEQLYPGIVSSVLLGGDPLPVANFVADYFERVAVQLPVLPRPESVPFMESPSAVPV
jgi:RelE toxin of RelE / RelB toxin-antitoxin system